MSDVSRDGEGRFNFAALDANGETPIAGEVIRGMQMQGELDAAVAKGLITPAQRPHFEKMAMNDLAGFRELVKTMKPVVDTRTHGLGGGAADGDDLAKIEGVIHTKTLEKMTASGGKMPYHEALKLVASETPDLDKRRTSLQRAKASKGDD
jgi:hypothetical protein